MNEKNAARCEGFCDDCADAAPLLTYEQGYGPARLFCKPCAAAYETWLANYDPPDPDGEVFRGGEAAAYQAEQMESARRLK